MSKSFLPEMRFVQASSSGCAIAVTSDLKASGTMVFITVVRAP